MAKSPRWERVSSDYPAIPACILGDTELGRLSWPMSIEREYEIVLQPEPEGGFSLLVPELPSVATQSETIEEATEMAKEAVGAYLEVMQEDGLQSRSATAAASQSTPT